MRGTGNLAAQVVSGGLRQADFIDMMLTPREVTGLFSELRSLSTAGAVADWMRSKGITGKTTDKERCPVANATRGLPGFIDAEINDDHLYARVQLANGNQMTFHEALSPALRTFVERFDSGHFPDLVSKDE